VFSPQDTLDMVAQFFTYTLPSPEEASTTPSTVETGHSEANPTSDTSTNQTESDAPKTYFKVVRISPIMLKIDYTVTLSFYICVHRYE
jgi:hypothetical protein